MEVDPREKPKDKIIMPHTERKGDVLLDEVFKEIEELEKIKDEIEKGLNQELQETTGQTEEGRVSKLRTVLGILNTDLKEALKVISESGIEYKIYKPEKPEGGVDLKKLIDDDDESN